MREPTLCFAASEQLTTEQIIEIRDGLRSGDIKLDVEVGVPVTPELERWLQESRTALIETYDAILARRRS